MAKRGEKNRKYLPWDETDPRGMGVSVLRYLDALRLKGFTEVTIRGNDHTLRLFSVWLELRSLKQPREVTRPILERYQRYLMNYRKENGEPLSLTCITGRLVMVRSFFSWLTKNNYLLANPAADLELPRVDKRLPQTVLGVEQVEAILHLPDIKEPFGLRDRAMLETFYSTGIRRMELLNLKIHDVDVSRGTMMIRLGKGRKDRMIPVGDRAIAWLNKYLSEVRPTLVMEPDEGFIFLSAEGKRLSKSRVTDIVGGYVREAGIIHGSCHIFRHAMATLMLEGGADIRYIQQMLGHAHLNTTEVYTQVSMKKLKEIHSQTHPAACLGAASRKKSAGKSEDGDEEPITKEEFLSSLAAEDPEEEDDEGKSGSARTVKPTGSASKNSDHAKRGNSGPAHRRREKGGKTAGRTAR